MEKVIVTIARQYGSGGKTIGTMLAEDLGIKAYSREILRLASEESGINEALFNKADERLKSTSLFGIMKREYKGELIPPESDDFTSNRNLFNYQAKVIKALAEEESCVIIGRCADFILKDREDVLNVFIHGNMPEKVKRICKLYEVTKAEAIKMINDTDKRRRTNYNFYTEQKWGMAGNYTLSLNSSGLGYDMCQKIIMECAG